LQQLSGKNDKMKVRQMLKNWWQALCSPPARYSLLSLMSFGFVAGVIVWGGFNTGIEATNTTEFCISCHEIRGNVYQEYQKSLHYSNRFGVRTSCSDCHVPKDWIHKMSRKFEASAELWGKLTGSIDTREKFEARRPELAKREWARMRASDSRECRNCHSYEAMNSAIQNKDAQTKHMLAIQPNSGKTCIDCHKGLAHELPAGAENY